MAFQIKQMVLRTSIPVRALGRYNHHEYVDTDAAATILAAGYFNGYRERLKVNDRIQIMASWDAVAATGDLLDVKVTAVPAVGSDVTVAVNTEASGA